MARNLKSFDIIIFNKIKVENIKTTETILDNTTLTANKIILDLLNAS